MHLSQIAIDPLSLLGPEPVLSERTYESRLAALRTRMTAASLKVVLVHADREHYANAAYLTGFDPRFEEAVIVVGHAGAPRVITGNESISLCERAGVEVVGVLCQSLSLPSQDRSKRRRLSDALAEAGVTPGDRVGVVGWKPVPQADAPDAPYALAVPQFVMSEIESFLDAPIVDSTGLIAGLDGMRADNEAEQLALHEHRATRASHCIWRALQRLRPGITELNISEAMRLVGLPLACHVMCTSGTESVNGLRSASDRAISEGDSFSAAVGYWGGLCCRAGLVVDSRSSAAEAYVERFAAPYYRAVVAWYEGLRVGARAGEILAGVHRVLKPTTVRPLLEAGHLIHLDEWFDTPFVPTSTVALRSGLALQCDIIPISSTFPSDAANVEDSLALADAELRAELADRFPEMWRRIQGRRKVMTDVLGIEIADEVLPFSDRQAVFTPALLSRDVALVQ